MLDTGVVLEDARDECDGQNNYETTLGSGVSPLHDWRGLCTFFHQDQHHPESGLMRCGLQLDGANIMNQTNSYSDQREQVNLS